MKPLCLQLLIVPLAVLLDPNVALSAARDLSPARQEAGKSTTRTARYVNTQPDGLLATTIKTYALTWGPEEQVDVTRYHWLHLRGTKANGEEFRLWLLVNAYPPRALDAAAPRIARFILQTGTAEPLEFRNRTTGKPVLPSLGSWPYLLPRGSEVGNEPNAIEPFPQASRLLGQSYHLEAVDASGGDLAPPTARVVRLEPDRLVGVPSNTRQKDPTRRYDGSEYELIRLTGENYREMADAGINCFRVDREQLAWVQGLDVFYWGLGAQELPFPECLYDGRYLGPALFLDEPAVGTRDHVLRPKLSQDPGFRKAIGPGLAFDAFREYYGKAWQEGAAKNLIQSLAGRADVALGDMTFAQGNLFSWETMVSTAAYQLSQDRTVPAAMVFEPPGRVGTRRTLPELDMTYGCQIPTDNPHFFIDIIYGFLRGAARLTNKSWGTSIYGAVDRSDAFAFLARAYDLGATRFFFWDNAQLACVPYPECLALARFLQGRAESHPRPDLDALRAAAEVAIIFPGGYNLGHVFLGKGNLWGLSELNLERINQHGVAYRAVMGNGFTEIERCLRLGVAFDLFGDFPGLQLPNYREIVRIREDGKVEVSEDGHVSILDEARRPVRPGGSSPELAVHLSPEEGKAPLEVTAQATVAQTSAPVYYTFGTDRSGVYQNAVVAWELYGPDEEDHRFITPPALQPHVTRTGSHWEVTTHFRLARPGQYRLRAAAVDLAGRSTVRWTPIVAR